MLTYNTAKTLFRINMTFAAVALVFGVAIVWLHLSRGDGDSVIQAVGGMKAALTVQWAAFVGQMLWRPRGVGGDK